MRPDRWTATEPYNVCEFDADENLVDVIARAAKRDAAFEEYKKAVAARPGRLIVMAWRIRTIKRSDRDE